MRGAILLEPKGVLLSQDEHAAKLRQVSEELRDLREEAGAKNHVQVWVHRALPKGQGRTWEWSRGDLVSNIVGLGSKGEGQSLPLLPMLAMHDRLSVLAGKKPMFLKEAVRRTGGEFVSVTYNLRTTIGIDYASSAIGDSSGSRAAIAQYIALSNSTGTLATSDTSATTGAAGTGINWGTANATDAAAANTRGEYTALGLARALAAYAHTASTASYTMSKTFTASATITAVQTCGLFNTVTQGQASSLTSALFVENNFTATSLANGDQLTITWTINI